MNSTICKGYFLGGEVEPGVFHGAITSLPGLEIEEDEQQQEPVEETQSEATAEAEEHAERN